MNGRHRPSAGTVPPSPTAGRRGHSAMKITGTWRPNVLIEGQSSQAPAALSSYLAQLVMIHQGDGSQDIWYGVHAR